MKIIESKTYKKYVIAKQGTEKYGLVPGRRYRHYKEDLYGEQSNGKKQHPRYLVHTLWDPVEDKDIRVSTLSFDKNGFIITRLEQIVDLADNQSHEEMKEETQTQFIAIDTSMWTAVHGNDFNANNLWIFNTKKQNVKYSEEQAGVDYFVYSGKYSAAESMAAKFAADRGVSILYLVNNSVVESRTLGIVKAVLGEDVNHFISSHFSAVMDKKNQMASFIKSL